MLSAISEYGYVEWHKTEPTQLFGIEVFLNAAQSSIAAAVDATTNAWIIAAMKDIEEKTSYDEKLLGLWIGVRLRILGSVLAAEGSSQAPDITGTFPWYDERTPPEDPRRTAYLGELWRTFERYSDTITAQQEIHNLAGNNIKHISWPPPEHPDEDRERILLHLWDTMEVNKAGSVAIILSRVNAFKHLTKGVSDRYDFVYAIEWILTAKALEWVSAFWREMLAYDKERQSTL